MVLLEVCAESVDSALIAQQNGASRVEFCANMAEGGTTQSAGNILAARRELEIALFPIVRPRGGDFVYSEAEFEAMRHDVRFCGEAGCEGIVTGILRPDGTVDVARCRVLVDIAGDYGMEVTFHRALDVCRELSASLEDIIDIGFDRVLTSGGAPTAPEGVETIASLVEQAAGRIIVMPGSGVTPENAADIICRTGCTEIHGTFRSRTESGDFRPGWADFSRWQPDGGKIRKVIENLKIPCKA